MLSTHNVNGFMVMSLKDSNRSMSRSEQEEREELGNAREVKHLERLWEMRIKSWKIHEGGIIPGFAVGQEWMMGREPLSSCLGRELRLGIVLLMCTPTFNPVEI